VRYDRVMIMVNGPGSYVSNKVPCNIGISSILSFLKIHGGHGTYIFVVQGTIWLVVT